MAKKQGLKRGWLTYTELIQLLPTFSIAKQIINYSTILALSYVAGVVSILGGFFVASHVPGTSLSSTSTKTCTSSCSTLDSKTTTIRSGSENRSTISGNSDEIMTDVNNETDLDYMMEDLNDSLGNYQEEINVPACKNTTIPNLFDDLNVLLQMKCNYGTGVGINNGVLLRNYLDDDGKRKNRTNWSWITELLGQLKGHQNEHDDGNELNPVKLFPTVWLKFI